MGYNDKLNQLFFERFAALRLDPRPGGLVSILDATVSLKSIIVTQID